ncbi:MAG TPA: 4-alpha-glucanotransferase [Gaiellaceae bacterium]|nr:4-alpha-glucanotransferase [Gaiellaceae bacterium]
MRLERASGILLHPTSLPNGVPDHHAYRFVDWLHAAGQRWWQVLPLGPTDHTGSPYMSPSVFAGSPELVADPTSLVTPGERDAFRAANAYWIGDWLAYGGDLDQQIRFEREWRSLRAYAAARGIRIVGDIPIYAGWDGADQRAHPELFLRDAIAGVPPDAFSATGQLWKNPLYDWAALRLDGYRWWTERLRRAFRLVDLARIDHFRGFVSYWAVPAGSETAANGRWRRGPGASVFHAAEAKLGPLDVVAEDLGVITEPVRRLRMELGFPGMVVLQFVVGGGPDSPHLPHNHVEQSVAYTGTHDNDTAAGWWATLPDSERATTGLRGDDPAWELLELTWSSVAALAIAPVQDVLGLGSEGRMNTPGTEVGNWSWRLEPDALTAGLAARLRALGERTGRVA